MDVNAALGELETVAKKLEVEVTYDNLTGDGMSAGGLCKLRGKWRVIIERRSSPSERLSVLAQALSRFDLEPHFLSPQVRELVDRFRGGGRPAPGPLTASVDTTPDTPVDTTPDTPVPDPPVAASDQAAAPSDQPAAPPAAAQTLPGDEASVAASSPAAAPTGTATDAGDQPLS